MSEGTVEAALNADYEFAYELRRLSMQHTSASMHAYDFKCACDLCRNLPEILKRLDALAALRSRGSSDTRLTEATFAEQLDALIFAWWGETEIDSPEARSALKNLKRAAEDLAALAAARADAPQEQT